MKMVRKTQIILAALAIFSAGSALAEIQTRLLPAPPQSPVNTQVQPICEDVSLSVYFSAYETMLSSYARHALSNAHDTLKNCAITSIEAVAVSEESHNDEAMADLSTTRAIAVIDALAANGIDAPQTEFRIAPVSETHKGQPATILARRVDVTLHAAPGHGL